MSILISGESLSKAFGSKQLFQDLYISVYEGDRIGLIGQNGSGKSTLLKILSGQENADQGNLSLRRNLKIGYLPQVCEFPDQKPIDVLLEALKNNSQDDEYQHEVIAKTWMSKLGFTGLEPSAALLSGGWKKRLMLAKQMITSPDVLLLDEPTNHLDLEGILWLEKFLSEEVSTYLIVSHDRYFLQQVANRTIELSFAYPKGLFAIKGPYAYFLEKKEEFLQGQLQQERSVASKARRELEWLRSNPKARTTKSQSRIDHAHEILGELSDIQKRNQKSKAAIDFTSSERITKKLLAAKNICKELGGRVLFKGLDFTLTPGTRMALMGPNGSGKTTLLKLLANEISLDQGTLKRADNLKVVYFDQHRNQLPNHLTLREALSPTGDYVSYHGQSIHVNGWCKRFLFSPDIIDMPISKLSGGERARITIAHLMLQEADLLLLDEPTNDLDIPTLETLEESLIDFHGAVVLITHDRCMLDRICNTFLALGDIAQTQLFASYAQWEASVKTVASPSSKTKMPKTSTPSADMATKSKLTYAEKKEYDQIEAKILKLEDKIKELNSFLENPELAQDSIALSEICTEVSLTETSIERLYLRWEELEKKQLSTT